MNITILGVGNAGTTIAADLANKGHRITLLKTSKSINNENYKKILSTKVIQVQDPFSGNYNSQIENITEDYSVAIPNADIIIVFVQTNYHESVIMKMSKYLKDGQVVIFEPGYLSTAYLLKYCDKKVISIEAESSPIDCRIIEPGICQVLFKNVLNPFGVYPKSEEKNAKKFLDELGYPYRFTENVIDAALHNPNLIVHTVGAIFSVPRIEYTKGEYWMYKEVFTPSVWNVCEALDSEKISILAGSGVQNHQKYVEACQERNFINDSRSPLDSFFDYATNSSPKGPKVSNSRYLTEDVPQGLVLLESLGKVMGIKTPICTSLIDLASAAMLTDYRVEGRTVEKLGYGRIKKIINENINNKFI